MQLIRPTGIDSTIKLYMRMNGANGAVAFYDDSQSHHTLAPQGTAQISTAQSKFGGSSGLLDGNSDYVTSADYMVATGNINNPMTVHCFVYRTTLQYAYFMIQRTPAQALAGDFYIYMCPTTGKLEFGRFTGTSTNIKYAISTLAIAINAWHHMVVQWNSNGSITFGIDGTAENIAQSTTTSNVKSGAFSLGAEPAPNYFYKGYIDDLKINDGIERYPRTGAYTVPTRSLI